MKIEYTVARLTHQRPIAGVCVLLHEGEDLANFGFKGLCAVDPVDGHALAFHAAEPGHLPFGEAADVGVEVAEHLVVAALATEVCGDVAVFEAIAQEAFFGHTAVKEGADFFNHAFFEPLAEADTDALDDDFAGEADANYDMLHGGHVGVFVGMLDVVFLDFESTEEAVAGLGIGVVVEFDIASQTLSEFFIGEGLHALAEVGVNGCVSELVAPHDGVDVHACTTAEDGLAATGYDVVEGADEVVLELIHIVFVAGIVDVDKVVWNVGAVDVVVGEVFAGADVHAAEYLARVGTNNLTAELEGQFGGEACFATGGRACYGEEFSRQGSRVCRAACRIRTRRSRRGLRG